MTGREGMWSVRRWVRAATGALASALSLIPTTSRTIPEALTVITTAPNRRERYTFVAENNDLEFASVVWSRLTGLDPTPPVWGRRWPS
jgi:hypothetical protein